MELDGPIVDVVDRCTCKKNRLDWLPFNIAPMMESASGSATSLVAYATKVPVSTMTTHQPALRKLSSRDLLGAAHSVAKNSTRRCCT